MESFYEDMVREVAEAEEKYKKLNQDLSKMLGEFSATLPSDDVVTATQIHTASFEKMTADMKMLAESEQRQKQATLDIATELKLLNEKVDASHQEQKASAKIATRRENLTLFVAILTLIATVLIGVVSILLQTRSPQQMSQQGSGESVQTVASDDIHGG